MTRHLLVFLAVSVMLIVSACGGGDGSAQDETSASNAAPTGSGATTPTNNSDGLEQGARSALDENARLSAYVLEHNVVPEWAQKSTRGPALKALMSAAADRRKQKIRVRLVSRQYEITSLKLDPSLTAASAVVRDRQRVRPYRQGRPLGKAVSLDERATVELRRLGNTEDFVVWDVMSQ